MKEDNAVPFESWGLIELFGRQRIAGRMSEKVIAGGTYLRIDVPAIGNILEHTRFFGQAAIYGITPTTEEVARWLAAGLAIEAHTDIRPAGTAPAGAFRRPRPRRLKDKSNCAVLGNLDSLYVARVMRERAEQTLRGQPG